MLFSAKIIIKSKIVKRILFRAVKLVFAAALRMVINKIEINSIAIARSTPTKLPNNFGIFPNMDNQNCFLLVL